MQDGVVKEVPTIEILTKRKMIKSESPRKMAIMEDHQMVMIQMIVTTMGAAEMMTPHVVLAIPYQAAVTPSIHRQT